MKAQISRQSAKLAWSDIPFLLSVCEAGSLAAAAQSMGVNHSTVYRRVEAVEARLGVQLFERRSPGYVMTAAGEHFYEQATPFCEALDRIELELGGRDLRLEGRISVTTTDSLLHCLAPVFARFQEAHPKVELQILADAQSLDLSRRDADIALRPTHRPPEHWVGRALAPILCATYVDEDYWNEAKDRDPSDFRWLTLDDDLNQSPMSRITTRRRPIETPVTVFNTVLGMVDGGQSGSGTCGSTNLPRRLYTRFGPN